MNRWKNMKAVSSSLAFLAAVVGMQSAMADSVKAKKAPPPPPKKEISIEVLPDEALEPAAANAPSAPRFKQKKYDETLLNKYAFLQVVTYEKPKNAENLSPEEVQRMIQNGELERVVDQFDFREMYANRDDLAVMLGLAEADGTETYEKCHAFRKDENGKSVPCGYFYTSWRIKPHGQPELIRHGKRAGYDYGEFSLALRSGAKNLDDWFRSEIGLDYQGSRIVAGTVMVAATALLWKWRAKKWAAIEKKFLEDPVNNKDLAWIIKVLRSTKTNFLTGHWYPVAVETKSGRQARIMGQVMMLGMGYAMLYNTYMTEDMGHGFLGIPFPSFGKALLWLVLARSAEKEVAEMAYATGKMIDAQCLFGQFLPKESALQQACGADAALKAQEKFNLGPALAKPSQEVPDVQLEEDLGSMKAFQEFEKQRDALKQEFAEKAKNERWLSERSVKLSTESIPSQLLESKNGIDFEARARERFLSAYKKSGTMRPKPEFHAIEMK